VQKWLQQSRCRLGSGLRWAQGIVLHGDPEVLRDVAMATSFGTQFAITGFVGYNFHCMIASDTLFDSGVDFQGQAIRRGHSQDRVSKGRCNGNQFWD